MLKKKELSKKKNLLMLLWDECIAFKVLFFILAYVAIAFINMPLEKWLEVHVSEWRDVDVRHRLFFFQWLTHEKANFIDNSFIVLPIFEVLAVALIYLIVMKCFYFVSEIIAYKNYCYIPLTEDEVKKTEFKNADEYFTYVLNMLSYGFKKKENLHVSDEELKKMLIVCLNVFPNNGTIFQINPETARKVSGTSFSEAVELNCGKAEIIDGGVELSDEEGKDIWSW